MGRLFTILAISWLMSHISLDTALAQSAATNGLYVGNNGNANIFQTTNPPGNHSMWIDPTGGTPTGAVSTMVVGNNGKASIYHYDPSLNHWILVNP